MAEKYSGIARGKPMNASDVEGALDLKANASEMTAALALKENISNKKTSISSTSDTEYPTSRAVSTALALKENASNKKTSISSTSDTEYPTSRAVATALAAKAAASDVSALQTAVGGLQAKLPVGTILMYDGTGWVNNSTLPGWYQCDGQNGTPNLTDLFIRGAASSGGTGGANSQEISIGTNNLPKHTHTLTSTKVTANTAGNHKHGLRSTEQDLEEVHGFQWHLVIESRKNAIAVSWGTGIITDYYETFRETPGSSNMLDAMSTTGSHSHTVSGTTDENSSTQSKITVSTVPGYYAVIYIKRVA
ncbi:MAG: hypothetical protein LBQ83_02020 [Candidatus Margulisbacteria bacterium]|jgi:hypothetical protein|nr:hypothetical protein [Candidatus Margulisiibacteriota bacterium]